MGRQLAAQWQGAHRVPESAVVRKTGPARRRNPLPFILAGVVLVALIGGVAVAAPGLVSPHDTSAAPTPAPSAVVPPPAPSADASAPATSAAPDPTAAPTSAPSGRVVTPRPRTPAPTLQPTPPPPPPDYVSPVVGPVGTIFHITFTGLPAAAPYHELHARVGDHRVHDRRGTVERRGDLRSADQYRELPAGHVLLHDPRGQRGEDRHLPSDELGRAEAGQARASSP